MADGVGGELIAQPLGPAGGLNWVFLIEIVTCTILSVFFIFYFNRLFATVLSYLIRAYTWHKYRAYVDITSLQISILGGRLFFKSIRYHGENETILIHDGRLTWRYWLYNVQQAEVFRNASCHMDHESTNRNDNPPSNGLEADPKPENITGSSHATTQPKRQVELPCRLHLRVSGVEAFLYNRTPIYDDLLASFNTKTCESACESPSVKTDLPVENVQSGSSHVQSDDTRVDEKPSRANLQSLRRETTMKDCAVAGPLPSYLRAFPIHIECKRAAAAIGNEHTTSVIVAKTDHAESRIDAAESGPLDLYKILFSFDATKVSVAMKPNVDFKHKQHEAAADFTVSEAPKLSKKRRRLLSPLQRLFKIVMSPLQFIARLCHPIEQRPQFRRRSSVSIKRGVDVSTSSNMSEHRTDWHGLERFLDDDELDMTSDSLDGDEYARFSSLADCSAVHLDLFWDVPGSMPAFEKSTKDTLYEPPAYGADITLKQSTITYGPWADRQRLILQNIFFPQSYVDYAQKMIPGPGQLRFPTSFTLNMVLEEDVTLRIPTREPSKDWEHSKPRWSQPEEPSTPMSKQRKGKRNSRSKKTRPPSDSRPFAWVDVLAKQGSSIYYRADQVGFSGNFDNTLSVRIPEVQISSSVNHDVMLKTGKLSVGGDLSVPLQWKSLRTWTFDIDCQDLDLYILRDHFFLITDLVSDWSVGPPSDYFTMVPFRYNLKLHFDDATLIMNTNDANIIDMPTSPNDNNFLLLRITSLDGALEIPMELYRPTMNKISFDVIGQDLSLQIQNPPRVTYHYFLHQKKLATLPRLTLKGSHSYYLAQTATLSDTLKMDIEGDSLRLTLFGFLMRHLVNLKENYFGDFIHYRTSQELQRPVDTLVSALDEENQRYAFRPSNDLDVLLNIIVKDPVIELPTRLYSPGDALALKVPIANVDLRVTNYYLDLQLNVLPLELSLGSRQPDSLDDSIRIKGLSLQGHRLFGLPPIEPAYASTWNINVGHLAGHLSATAVSDLVRAADAFIIAIKDDENAVPLIEVQAEPEVVFVHVNTAGLALFVPMATHTLGVTTNPFALDFDDTPLDNLGAGRLQTFVPSIHVFCASNEDLPRHSHNMIDSPPTKTEASLRTSLNLLLLQHDGSLDERRQRQQRFLTAQDVRTHRASFLSDIASVKAATTHLPAPTIFVPALPTPLRSQDYGRPSDTLPMMTKDVASMSQSSLSSTPSPRPRTTVLIDCQPSLRGTMKLSVINALLDLATALKTSDPEEVLDAFQIEIFKALDANTQSYKDKQPKVDIRVVLPSLDIGLLVPYTLTPNRQQFQVIDLSIHQLTFSARLDPSNGPNVGPPTALLHFGLASLSLVASSMFPNVRSKSEFARVDGEAALMWCSLSTDSSIHVSLDVLTTSITHHELDSLINLGFRISDSAARFARRISESKAEHTHQLRQLLGAINTYKRIIDVPHLGRLPYLLRVCPDHIRNEESWRMLARLRHAFLSIPSDTLATVTRDMCEQMPTEAANTRDILDNWSQWCTWDVPDPESTHVYKAVYGGFNLDEDNRNGQLLVIVHTGTIRAAFVSAGANLGDIYITGHTSQITKFPPSESAQLLTSNEKPLHLVMVHSTIADALVNLRWGLINLIDPLFQALASSGVAGNSSPMSQPSMAHGHELSPMEQALKFHSVASIDNVSLIVSTPHLQLALGLDDLQSSVVGVPAVTRDVSVTYTGLIKSKICRLDLKGDQYHIASLQLTDLTLMLSQEWRQEDSPSILEAGVIFEKLNINSDQELLDLVPLSIKVLQHEATEISKLMDTLDSYEKPADGLRDPQKPRLHGDINFVLLAGQYIVDLALFQDLQHIIHGNSLDLRITNKASSNFNVDLRIEPVSYTIRTSKRRSSATDATLNTPLLVLSQSLNLDRSRKSIAGAVDVGKTNIKAAVLYDMVVMLQDAELGDWATVATDSFSQLQYQIDQFQSRTRRLSQVGATIPKSASTFMYDINLYNAGIVVLGTAPLRGDSNGGVDLWLGVDPIQISVKNRASTGPGCNIPDIVMQIPGLFADLELTRRGQKSKAGHARFALLVRVSHEEARPLSAKSGFVVEAKSDALEMESSNITLPILVALVTHFDQKVQSLDLSDEIKQLRQIKAHRSRSLKSKPVSSKDRKTGSMTSIGNLVPSLSLRLDRIRLAFMDDDQQMHRAKVHNAEVTVGRIDLRTKRSESARLAISQVQVKLSPREGQSWSQPVLSATLPEVELDATVNYEQYGHAIDFNASGQALDLFVQSHCLGAINHLRHATRNVVQDYQKASKKWRVFRVHGRTRQRNSASLRPHIVKSLNAHAKFAGGVLNLRSISSTPAKGASLNDVVVRAPGVALNIEYSKGRVDASDSSLFVDVQIQGSSNAISPDLVPFIVQMSSSVKNDMQKKQDRSEVVAVAVEAPDAGREATSFLYGSSVLTSNAVLAKSRVSFGLRIGRQEFQLSCKPLARIDANVQIEDIYITAHTIEGPAGDRLFSLSSCFKKFSASISHMYSRAPTISFGMDSLNVSVMSEKHRDTATAGLLVSMLIEPIHSAVNARQIQDVLIFRDVWLPGHVVDDTEGIDKAEPAEDHLVQRYRQMTNAAAFPWDVVVALEAVNIDVDFGQSIGKHVFIVHDLWARSTKHVNSQQELYVGLEKVDLTCSGRMGGIFELQDVRVKSSIQWPQDTTAPQQTPLVTANISFDRLRLKASFDYQPFVFADIGKFYFQMFNVKSAEKSGIDRLVAVLDGGQVFIFCTATSPAQAVGLYQAFERLAREKQTAYASSRREMILEGAPRTVSGELSKGSVVRTAVQPERKHGISLRSRVIVTFGQISLGAFPTTFVDNQLLKFDASGMRAEAFIGITDARVHSDLGLEIGQLQVALAAVRRLSVSRTMAEITVDDVIQHGVGAGGGTILRVPRVVAAMQTWQAPDARQVDYIFRSTFQGKVDVGWNYARITYIRGMWNTYTRTLAARLGKSLPDSAVTITASPDKPRKESAAEGEGSVTEDDAKITAIINMPAARFDYNPLVEPIIETPQLRDMGEATPPLEWIGLNRERLPSVVHQVVVMALLEVAKEVEGAYGRILGAT